MRCGVFILDTWLAELASVLENRFLIFLLLDLTKSDDSYIPIKV